MSQALTISAVQSHLATLAPEIAKTLPPGMTPERFNRVALTAIQNTPKLLECRQDSLFNACMKAAQDGLLPDGREGAIIPRWDGKEKVTLASWQPMVHGIIKKAKSSGSVASLVANVVYKGEVFEVEMGDDERIVHRRALGKVKRGEEIAVYAIASLKDGTKEREVMSWQQVMDVRAMSAFPDRGPWATSTDEMARKTVIRRLSKRLPSLDDGDDELRQAIERVDSEYDFGRKPAGPTIEARAEVVEPAAPTPEQLAQQYADDWTAKLDNAHTYEAVNELVGSKGLMNLLTRLQVVAPALYDKVEQAKQRAMDRSINDAPPPEDERVYDVERGEVV
jgi:recombination protein RecT